MKKMHIKMKHRQQIAHRELDVNMQRNKTRTSPLTLYKIKLQMNQESQSKNKYYFLTQRHN